MLDTTGPLLGGSGARSISIDRAIFDRICRSIMVVVVRTYRDCIRSVLDGRTERTQ